MLFQRNLLLKENGLFYRELAFLFASGATLLEAFTVLRDEASDSKTVKMAEAIHARLSRGDSVVASLSDYPHVFNPTLIYLLSGNNEPVKAAEFLYQYADEIERLDAVKARLLQTLVYPAKILVFAFVVMLFLMIFIFPVFQDMFSGFGTSLPWPTRLLLGISSIVKHYGIFILAGLIGLFFFISNSQKFVYRLAASLPGLKALLADFSIYSFSKYLSILIPLHRPLPETIEQAARMLRDNAYAERIIRISRQIENLEQFIKQARNDKILPGLFCGALAIGSRTHSLDKLLAEQARFYDRRIDKRIDIVTNFFEAFGIIFIGILVGLMVIALYLPIFQLASIVVG